MRKGTVVSLKSCNKIFNFLKLNRVLLILTLCFILGFLIGIFTADKYEAVNNFNSTVFENFIANRSDRSFWQIAVKSFFNSMLFILLEFACGTSALGVVFVPLCVGARGFLYGGTAALLYSEHLLKGIAFHTVLILPKAVIFIFGFLLAARESFDFSLMLARLTLPQTMPMNISFQFKSYCIKYIAVLIIIVFSAVIDAILCGNFLTVFSL